MFGVLHNAKICQALQNISFVGQVWATMGDHGRRMSLLQAALVQQQAGRPWEPLGLAMRSLWVVFVRHLQCLREFARGSTWRGFNMRCDSIIEIGGIRMDSVGTSQVLMVPTPELTRLGSMISMSHFNCQPFSTSSGTITSLHWH